MTFKGRKGIFELPSLEYHFNHTDIYFFYALQSTVTTGAAITVTLTAPSPPADTSTEAPLSAESADDGND